MANMTTKPAETTSGRSFPWGLVGVVAIMLGFAMFGNRGILHIFKLKRQQAALEEQLAQIETVNNGLRREINSLSTDRNHLERMARSQLGMVREDEVVYQFGSKLRTAPPTVPATASR
jgi:cell division protein FtsB